jgi:ABC-type cobalt transport system, permease component CbiQ and related transporters
VIQYNPDTTIVHRLDPRTKLCIQAVVAAFAFAYTTPRGLIVFSIFAIICVIMSNLSFRRAIRAAQPALPFLIAAPIVTAIDISSWPPEIVPTAAIGASLASYRVLLIFVIAAVYLHTTPIRQSQAAIQWFIPGRIGRLLALGVSVVFRTLPLMRADIRHIRSAASARLIENRTRRERVRIIATAGLRRTFKRTDQLTLALQARCLTWNPTLPRLVFDRVDGVAVMFLTATIGVLILIG